MLSEQAGHLVTHLYDTKSESGLGINLATDAVAGDVEIAIDAWAEKHRFWFGLDKLDEKLPHHVPILAATFFSSATHAAWRCKHPARIVGFAALPPLADAKVIEFMPALQTSDEAKAKARAFWQSIGLEPVEVADSVGGVLPRIVCNLINEAAYALMEGVATAEDIDLAMQLGTAWPRGPLAWADLIGLDQVVAILDALGNEFGPDQYRPAPLLRQYARAGRKFYADDRPQTTDDC